MATNPWCIFPSISGYSCEAAKMGQKAPAASWWGDDSRTEKNRRVRSLASKVSSLKVLELQDLGFWVSDAGVLQESGCKAYAVNDRSGRKCDQSEPLLTTPQIKYFYILL